MWLFISKREQIQINSVLHSIWICIRSAPRSLKAAGSRSCSKPSPSARISAQVISSINQPQQPKLADLTDILYLLAEVLSLVSLSLIWVRSAGVMPDTSEFIMTQTSTQITDAKSEILIVLHGLNSTVKMCKKNTFTATEGQKFSPTQTTCFALVVIQEFSACKRNLTLQEDRPCLPARGMTWAMTS